MSKATPARKPAAKTKGKSKTAAASKTGTGAMGLKTPSKSRKASA